MTYVTSGLRPNGRVVKTIWWPWEPTLFVKTVIKPGVQWELWHQAAATVWWRGIHTKQQGGRQGQLQFRIHSMRSRNIILSFVLLCFSRFIHNDDEEQYDEVHKVKWKAPTFFCHRLITTCICVVLLQYFFSEEMRLEISWRTDDHWQYDIRYSNRRYPIVAY